MAVRAFPNEGDKFASKYRLLSALKISENLVIFQAIEIAFDRDVTLKIIRDSGNEESFSSFQTKSQSFSKLKTPFTTNLYSFGRTEGFLYVALEFVEGEDLRSFQLPNPPASVDQVINVFRQALFSLREAHGQGIIHGDLQLRNIMVVPTDEDDLSIKIRDFQIINFSAPEPEVEYTEKTDIKALGHILFALLAGYEEISPNMQSVHAPIPLKRIISKMLIGEEGYENVDDVLADLGSPTLLDSIAPKSISTKKIYAVGLAFGIFILAPLGWTSIQLLAEPTSEVSETEIRPLITQTKTALVEIPKPKNNALKKASGSINQAIPALKNPDPILVKQNTIPKKSKPAAKYTVKKTAVKASAQDIENETSAVVPSNIDEIEKEAEVKEPKFNPLKFSARKAPVTPQTTKKKVEKTKSAPKKQVIKKKTTKEKVPKKIAPVSF